MSILTSASGSSVSRGYDYFKNKKVKNISQLNDFEFEGYVNGSLKNPYYVKINIKHPKKSYCDCPHANGNIICKHMTALYFDLFPDEVDDYESWLNSDYEDDYYDDYDYDEDGYEYDDNYSSSSNFEKPLFFDIVLEKYVNELNIAQLRDVLLMELKNNEKRTYELYLEKKYKMFLNEHSNDYAFLDKLNKKVSNLLYYPNYNYSEFEEEILTAKEKKHLKELYKKENLRYQIDQILFNVKLAIYSDYKWIAEFYKENKNEYEISDFTNALKNYLDNLKHYSIKNTIPKSNVLIVMHIINDFTIQEVAESLLKNAKYLEYIDYVIENSNDIVKLYKEFIKLIEKNYFKNKMYIPDVLYRFVSATDFENEEISLSHDLYSFLCLGHIEYLKVLSHSLSEKDLIYSIENKTKDIFLLVKLYKLYDKKEKLWNLLINSNYRYLLLDNIEVLKDKYNDELYKHFVGEFYNILSEGKNRDVYNKAAKYVVALNKLNDGNKFVAKLIYDLKKSNYQKCTALFDEINKVISI